MSARQYFFHACTASCDPVCVLDAIRLDGDLTLMPDPVRLAAPAVPAAIDVERLARALPGYCPECGFDIAAAYEQEK